ncbi:hypothetical protein [Streptomyces sp. NPDC000618]|uniref:hypothetical protein n=1 Tax=Streptomyces sp. NPDC000618 TaxID=3154265 RepID=UPI00332D6E8A
MVVADHVVGPQVAVDDAVAVGGPGGFQFGELRQAVTGGGGEVGRRIGEQFVPAVQSRPFFLNSGLSKRDADQAAAQRLQRFATAAYPFLSKVRAIQASLATMRWSPLRSR